MKVAFDLTCQGHKPKHGKGFKQGRVTAIRTNRAGLGSEAASIQGAANLEALCCSAHSEILSTTRKLLLGLHFIYPADLTAGTFVIPGLTKASCTFST